MKKNVHALTLTKRILAISSKLQTCIPFHSEIPVLGGSMAKTTVRPPRSPVKIHLYNM